MDIIIVHDRKKITKQIADIFKAMISEFDDINSVVWDEKQYIDTNPDVSSEQYLIFIGNIKTANNLMSAPTFHIAWEKINMKYGWIGRQSVLFVNDDYKFNDNKLSELAALYNETFNKELEIRKEEKTKEPKKSFKERIMELPLPVKLAIGTGLSISTFLTGGIAGSLFLAAAGFATSGLGIISTATVSSYYIGNKLMKIKFNKDKIITDSYQILIKQFLTNGIQLFLKIEE